MIKLLFQLNELGYGGTTKAILSICSHLDRSQFEPYLFFHTDQGTIKQWERKLRSYLSRTKKNRYQELYSKNFSRQSAFQDILGENRLFQGQAADFFRVLNEIKPHIVHFNRGENEDWFTSLDLAPYKQVRFVETNIFGRSSNENYLQSLDRIFFISHWLLEKSSWDQDLGRILYNPILKPQSSENLREDLQIPKSAYVIGRLSRPGLDDGMQAYEIFKAAADPEDFYIVLGASNEIMEIAETDSRVRAFVSSVDDNWISKFYNTMDVLLHYRHEGETFGMNIAEAMMHEKPIVSHRSFLDNAQSELILPSTTMACGYVADQDRPLQQSEQISKLKKDVELRLKWGRAGRLRALNNFEASAVTRGLENQYLEVCKDHNNGPCC